MPRHIGTSLDDEALRSSNSPVPETAIIKKRGTGRKINLIRPAPSRRPSRFMLETPVSTTPPQPEPGTTRNKQEDGEGCTAEAAGEPRLFSARERGAGVVGARLDAPAWRAALLAVQGALAVYGGEGEEVSANRGAPYKKENK